MHERGVVDGTLTHTLNPFLLGDWDTCACLWRLSLLHVLVLEGCNMKTYFRIYAHYARYLPFNKKKGEQTLMPTFKQSIYVSMYLYIGMYVYIQTYISISFFLIEWNIMTIVGAISNICIGYTHANKDCLVIRPLLYTKLHLVILKTSS